MSILELFEFVVLVLVIRRGVRSVGSGGGVCRIDNDVSEVLADGTLELVRDTIADCYRKPIRWLL